MDAYQEDWPQTPSRNNNVPVAEEGGSPQIKESGDFSFTNRHL